MNMNTSIKGFVILLVLSVAVMSCDRTQRTGWEFAPNMYNSVGYEPLTQINKNNINPNGMNMRQPVEGTVSRRNYQTSFEKGDSSVVNDLMIYNIGRNDVEASESLVNPIPLSDAVLAKGEVLYKRNCSHCHGATGEGEGKVAEIYGGVPIYSSDAYKNLSPGRIYFAITHGKGRMWSHAAQVNPEERWEIVHYVQTLQKGK